MASVRADGRTDGRHEGGAFALIMPATDEDVHVLCWAMGKAGNLLLMSCGCLCAFVSINLLAV